MTMSIVLEEETPAYFNFINSLRSRETKRSYRWHIQKFTEFTALTLNKLLALPAEDVRNIIIKYLVNLSQKSYSYRNSAFCTIKHFYEMNDVTLNWKKIKRFIGSREREGLDSLEEEQKRDRAYTYEEIHKLLDFCDYRIKAAFLILISTGIRAGALRLIRLKHIEKISEHGVYKFRIYPGSSWEYLTFCTPECATAIDFYLDYRTRNGEKLTHESFLISQQFDVSDLSTMRRKNRGFAENSLENILEKHLVRAGIRTVNHLNRHERKDVARFNGFRKFTDTAMIKARLNITIKEMLLGHNTGLDRHYYRPTEDDLLQEYLKVVNLLTINEEYRLKKEIDDLRDKQNEIVLLRKELQPLLTLKDTLLNQGLLKEISSESI
jgi:integrase